MSYSFFEFDGDFPPSALEIVDDVADNISGKCQGLTIKALHKVTDIPISDTAVDLTTAIRMGVKKTLQNRVRIKPIVAKDILSLRKAVFNVRGEETFARVGPSGAEDVGKEIWNNLNISDAGVSVYSVGSGRYNLWGIRNKIDGYGWYTIEVAHFGGTKTFVAGYDGFCWSVLQVEGFPGFFLELRDGIFYTGGEVFEYYTDSIASHPLCIAAVPVFSPIELLRIGVHKAVSDGMILCIGGFQYRLKDTPDFTVCAQGEMAYDKNGASYVLSNSVHGMVDIARKNAMCGGSPVYSVVRRRADRNTPDSTSKIKTLSKFITTGDYNELVGVGRRVEIEGKKNPISWFTRTVSSKFLDVKSEILHRYGFKMSDDVYEQIEGRSSYRLGLETTYRKGEFFRAGEYLEHFIARYAMFDYSQYYRWLHIKGYYWDRGQTYNPKHDHEGPSLYKFMESRVNHNILVSLR